MFFLKHGVYVPKIVSVQKDLTNFLQEINDAIKTFKNGPVLYGPPGTCSATLPADKLYHLVTSAAW